MIEDMACLMSVLCVYLPYVHTKIAQGFVQTLSKHIEIDNRYWNVGREKKLLGYVFDAVYDKDPHLMQYIIKNHI